MPGKNRLGILCSGEISRSIKQKKEEVAPHRAILLRSGDRGMRGTAFYLNPEMGRGMRFRGTCLSGAGKDHLASQYHCRWRGRSGVREAQMRDEGK